MILFTCGLLSAQHTTASPWQMQSSHTTAGLRGIHAVNAQIAWASGTSGTVLRTTDGGQHWQRCATPPDATKLDFRGIWAWDANTAIIMSSGPGALSRLYKTTDACAHWKLLFTNPDKDGFWDAIVYLDKDYGYILGDPVGGSFVLLSTIDGGKNWKRQDRNFLETAPGGGAFAASNSSLWMNPVDPCYLGAGGTAGSFVFYTRAADIAPGYEWYKSRVPLASGIPSTGIFSLAFRDLQHGMAVGGDYTKPNDPSGTAAWTADGGRHWTAAKIPPHGYRSAVAWDASAKAWIAAGTNGSDISYDDGKTWQPLDNGNWNALSLPWIVGPNGRIARLDSQALSKEGAAKLR
ncbi:MAG TPA: hypothetical protein VMU92_09310 [Acidobacteriaceae bacterium]|nr:hypothetical protein [Acidobacteriaceae bacterium]